LYFILTNVLPRYLHVRRKQIFCFVNDEANMATLAIKADTKAETQDLIIGQSPVMQALRDMIGRVARSSASVMITGASGSGKEMVARAIHQRSQRSAKAFVALNCGAIPADLIESELFGHERGSFTGAHSRRIGRFEEANNGTLFLDEIGDMRFDMQVKLLRVLEDGIVTRVGGTALTPVNVRIISATHRNIDVAIADNRFREDLFFRLGVVMIQVPDLASRVEDIPALVAHFQKGKPRGAIARFDTSGMARLMAHRWPGNVRELRNVVERAGVLSGGETLDSAAVEALLGNASARLISGSALRKVSDISPIAPPLPVTSVKADTAPIDLKDMLETLELERIQMALDMADGVISEAARMLTLKRTTLIEKMRKYGVDRTC
jgi:sigma-54 specific flagellar transcriptional regulator A